MKVASVHVYPVKSMAGQSVTQAEVEPWGLSQDRRWVVLDPGGAVITAREEHKLLGLSARPIENGIKLTARDGEGIKVLTPSAGGVIPAQVSRLESVRAAESEASDWLSRSLGRPVRLGWLDDPRRRSVSATHGGLVGDSLTLADAGPLLLTSTASLGQLNAWMDPVGNIEMARFRPNVIVDEVPEPFEEDGWRSIRIGAVQFRFAEICDRCVMTTIDPQTLSGGKEPLRTLARYRQWAHRTWFGIRVIPVSRGVIRIGDPLEVVSRLGDD